MQRYYSESNCCPKCGESAVRTTYKPNRWPDKFGEGCMERDCVRCGYSWREAPLDTKEDSDA